LVPQWRKEMIRQTRQMTPKRTNAGLLTSDSEPFAFFGVIWRILFGCGGAALGNPRLLTFLLLELMLKIALPTLGKRLDSDSSAQRFYIVSLKSIKTSDVGHADLLLRSAD
jgi:hypothetical protein